MANTFHQIYLQTIFAVKYRDAVINKNWRPNLLSVIGSLINDTGCKTYIVNGVEDHVHCLFGLKPTISISDLMQSVKGNSSRYVNKAGFTKARFEWQEGYGAFSYNRTQVNKIHSYIANQEFHHMQQSFHAEYIDLLNTNNIPFEEQNIFKNLE